MSVAEAEVVKPKKGELVERVVKYKPLNGGDEIELSINMVRKFLTKPTKEGREASDAEVVKFMMLCKAGSFDPWQGDAVLVGYDSGGGAEWSLITTVHAMMKRAELSDHFDGLEFGIVVMGADKQTVTERQGTIVYDHETLLGGWAKVYRKDRSRPFYCQVNLRTYDKGIFRWKTDRPGMIAKVAKGQAMRDAFSNSLSGVYLREEFDAMDQDPKQLAEAGAAKVAAATSLTEKLKARNESRPAIESKPEPEVYSELFDSLSRELLTVDTFDDLEPIEAEIAISKELTDSDRKRLKQLVSAKKSTLSTE